MPHGPRPDGSVGPPRRRPDAASRPLRPSSSAWCPQPVFLLSYLRSGSTMMRMVLNSHSQICAPLEMHLRALRLDTSTAKLLELAMQELRLSNRDLENMLWDRLLYDQLLKSGKSIIVDKTPHNTLSWRRIHRYWPDAKFILLYRHPVRMMESMHKAHPNTSPEHWGDQILRFAKAMDEAHKVHGGLVLRYEELTRDPAAQTRRICEFLGVPWEAGMIDYGNQQHGGFVRGLGDWSDKIKAGDDPAGTAGPGAVRRARLPARGRRDPRLPLTVPEIACARRTSASPTCPTSPTNRTTPTCRRRAADGLGRGRARRRRAGAAAARRAVVVVPVPHDDAGARRRRACARSRRT